MGKICLWGSGLAVIVILLFIMGLLVVRGGGVISWEFLTSAPKGVYLGMEGGIFPAIIGTISLVTIATLTAAIPALLTAIYLVEYGKASPLAHVINFVIQAMIGIPSILIGLFGYVFFVVTLGLGISLLAGGLTLAIMILPTLVVLMRDALQAVNDDYRLLGESLGVSRRYLLQRIILPVASPHLLSSILLAMGYAAGATAPIMVTAAVVMSRGSVSLFNPVMALPFHLYILFSQHISLERAYGTALVLVLILLALNLLSLYLRNRYGKRVAFDD
ncbi:Phosphate transport system permease protein PstA [Sporomusa ovata DSM 2662]|uniref:Phosphate transport system permease protein PstA n=1 Tax=Sporomusa ovata TaxID=2378 RepID=A0A0U1KTM9_9FIRM|nr:phosphate ABC transporter permease PstA [Sporomusa ovata]EQB26682.1 phosphate ABC transporter permease protein PstA [Sporomusa ovata DSM 2662]CQR70776.1 Phosphate transport system permease protein PstA (TC 3.A.1.7.1) [Sporomusa ovata]